MEKDGLEIPDPTPVSVPFGYSRPETLQEQMARMIRSEVSRIAGAQGYETFEEADDFSVDDDAELPYSPHEVVEMQEEVPASQFNELGRVKSGESTGRDREGISVDGSRERVGKGSVRGDGNRDAESEGEGSKSARDERSAGEGAIDI